MSAREQRRRKTRGPLAVSKGELARYRRSLERETDPNRRARLERNIGIRTAFIAKLMGPPKIYEPEITIIPGEFDIEWFDEEKS